ncbi:MAG: hypothetical protein CMJ32_10680 [Phycisphaerae bacterium]|nr:hypothetical protein [Phycisphaerae bacterium]
MPRKSNNRQKQTVDQACWAILKPDKTGWKAMVARIDGSMVELATMTDVSDLEGLESLIQDAQAAHVVEMLPSTTVISRLCPLPDAGKEQVQAALSLQAETHILGGIPKHRTVMASTSDSQGSGATGVIMAWPLERSIKPLELDEQVGYTPILTGLLGLCGEGGTDAPLIWTNSDDGTISLVYRSSKGLIIRNTLVEAAPGEPWGACVGRAFAESAFNANVPEDEVKRQVDWIESSLQGTNGPQLVLSDQVRNALADHVKGLPADAQWFQEWGLHLGVVLAAAGPMEPLMALRIDPPSKDQGLIANTAERMSEPRIAIGILIAAILVIGFGPAAIALARLGILKVKLPDRQAYELKLEDLDKQLEMYDELEQRSWPMTKLLADIACTTPEGIDLDQIVINHGERITLHGLAKKHDGMIATERIGLMQSQMYESRIFERVTPSWDKPNARGDYEFTLTAEIARPTYVFRYPEEQDFGALTLSERRYGKQEEPEEEESEAEEQSEVVADATAEIEPAAEEEESENPATEMVATTETTEDETTIDEENEEESTRDRRNLSRRGSGSSGLAKRGGGPDRTTTNPSDSLPELLTPEQISALTKTEAQEALARIAEARQLPGLDEQANEQLKNQFRLLLDRVKEAG